MQRVRGIGGVFFKSEDPEKLQAWYRDILGIQIDSFGGAFFRWSALDTSNGAGTVFAPFKADTVLFAKSEAVHGKLRRRQPGRNAGLKPGRVARWSRTKITEESYGKFGWLLDPEGNKIELWEPRTPKEAQ